MRARAAAFALLLACAAGCARRDTGRTVPQVAILRFENLSSDPSLDWMGDGLAQILSGALQGSPQRYAIQWPTLHSYQAILGKRLAAPGISSESTAALVAGANEIVYGNFSVAGGILRATANLEDLPTHKVVQLATASGSARDGIFPVAGAIARQLGGDHSFGTTNSEALRHFVTALESPDAPTASEAYARAVAADPDFGRAYVFWLDAAMAQRNRAQAELIVAQAAARQGRWSLLDRAALNLAAAALRGDFSAQLEARRQLASQDPANPNHHRALAEALMSVRDYETSLVEFRRGLSIRPDDAVALNSMGYAAAYSGDLPTAIRVLRGYEQLRPNQPNPLDSLGDAHFALGHFTEAEQFYLAADSKAPGFLNGGEVLKAAQARLMTGDVAGATKLFKRYLAGREAAHDPNAPYHAAEWLWLTGARRAAIASLDTTAATAPATARELPSMANAQAAIWLLNLGDRAGAAQHARQAVALEGPSKSPLIALVAFLAQPDVFPPPAPSPLADYARVYALLYGSQFQAAAQALQQIYLRPTNELDDGLAVLLAWTYEASGEWQRAEPLLRLTPLPQAAVLPMFSSLYFPRLFFLRGVVLGREGHRPEAARYYQLFRNLSGPDSALWGEEQRAR